MLRVGTLTLSPPFGLAPMAGLTDSAFRRLVKRLGGCTLVVTEMVSAEGLIRGHDRTLECAEYTEEERPVAVQIFGSEPDRMAAAARIVEQIGADMVDVNMGCPVPKIAKGNAGCRLMRDPGRAAAIVRAIGRAVRIPVTVKIRAGWTDREIVAPEFARAMADAGAAAVTVHGRTAEQAYRGLADWDLIARVARAVSIPVFGNGDCLEAADVVSRWKETGVGGVLVGRGLVRNPWLLAQAADLAAGRPPREVAGEDRARFLLEYIDLLLGGTTGEPEGFRRRAPERGQPRATPGARSQERWVIGKVRALAAWYTKGFGGGAHVRSAINQAESIEDVRESLRRFFAEAPITESAGRSASHAHLRIRVP